MNIVFMGTPDFAVPCLEAIVSAGHRVSLVVTQEDKPKGRGHQMMFPPVKEWAVAHELPVFQPKTLKTEEALATIAACQPDVAVIVAYGKLLPQAVLSVPHFGCINVHASLLPAYRGAAPIQWAILNGDTESGVTTMQMDAGLDTGDMLLSCRCPITDTMTAEDLHDRLMADGAALLCRTLEDLSAGALHPVKQPAESTTPYAAMLSKAMSPMDWSREAGALHNQVRGLYPWPGATTKIGGKTLKIHKTHVGGTVTAPAGTVTALRPLTVACGGGTSLVLEDVQYEGAKRMSADSFLCGHPLTVGQPLG